MSVPEFATRPQLSEEVARYVRNRIFDGTYAAGEYVRLDQLAERLHALVDELDSPAPEVVTAGRIRRKR